MIEVKIEASKARQLLETETWTDKKTGEQRSKQVIKFQLVDRKPESIKIIQLDNVTRTQKHNVVKAKTKEEKANKAETIYVGSAETLSFPNKDFNNGFEKVAPKPQDDDDLPF